MQPNNQQPIMQPQPGPQMAPPSGQIPQQQQPQPAAQPQHNPAANASSTQSSLLFSELRDNMIIMSDGSFRAVVACMSINFDLMSSREREGVEYSYQNFLNSLNHPVQILVRSQRVDIGPYIDKLSAMRRDQDNMLLNVLMDDYINFIDVLSQEANIMDKSFYIVIPFFPAGDINAVKDQAKGFFGKIFAGPNTTVKKINDETYEKAKTEIKNRVDAVMAGLFQMGIKCAQLNTKELGELYYNSYNPDTAVREPLGNFEDVTGLYVRRGTDPNSTPQPPQSTGGYNG